MERIEVESTNIAAVGWAQMKGQIGTLEVEFHNGSVYQYFDVPWRVYEGLLGAQSKGSYLNLLISGEYEYQRVS